MIVDPTSQASYQLALQVSFPLKISPVLPAGALNSNNKLSSACKPAQALKILFKASFYLPKELTKGQSTSVKGALHK